MNYTDRAIEALRAAEAALREIISQALAAKAYRDLAKVAATADAISVLMREFGGSSAESANAEVPIVSLGHRPVTVANQQENATRTSNTTTRRIGYPRFFRDGDRLVKLAWSKKKRRPYEHRAPRAIVGILLDAIRERKGEGKLFEAPDVLPLLGVNGEEYPSYQSYLVLAWLRHSGIVMKKGREGYILRRGIATPTKLEELWESLPMND